MFTVLNRAAGLELEDEEQASHTLSGGILRHGHACGQLWGSCLAIGARAERRFADPAMAQAASIHSAGLLFDEFGKQLSAVDCRDLIKQPLTSAAQRIRYVLSDKPGFCEQLAIKWAPAADQLIERGLKEFNPSALKQKPVNCAGLSMSMSAKAVGLEPQKYLVLAAGFAGGMGLKGNACGALAAAVFAMGLKFYRGAKKPRDTRMKAVFQEFGIGAVLMKSTAGLLAKFKREYGSKTCAEITGRKFSSMDDHTEFINGGGCKDLIRFTAENTRVS